MSDPAPDVPSLSRSGRRSAFFPDRDGDGRGSDESQSHADLMQLVAVLRRRIRLVAGVAAATVLVVILFLLSERPLYRATATVRLAYPRRALTVGVEDIPAARQQESDPLLSLIELLRGRAIVGAVVDSLGLRLQPPASFFKWSGRSSRIVRAALQDVRVRPDAPADTLNLRFAADRVIAQGNEGEVQVPYGSPLVAGSVQFIVPSHPGVVAGTLIVRRREKVIDDVLAILTIVRRKSTDIVDVSYSDPTPLMAQQVANLLVGVFLAGDAGSAQDQARRRAEFLAAQLSAIDSEMTQAQAQLSAFQSRRLMASSGDKLAGEQARLSALDTRRGELDADRRVYESFLAKFNTASDSNRLDVLRDLAYTPELAADPVVGRVSQQVLVYQTRLDSMVTGPFPAAPSNPDVVGLKALIRSTQEELVRALRAHLTSIAAQSQALAELLSRTGASFQPLPATEAEAMRLERSVEDLKSTGDRVQQEYANARMSEGVAAGDAQVIDLAPLPYKPAGIPPAGKLGLGLLLGLVLGCGSAALAESTNTSITQPEQLQRTLNLRDLGVIPPLFLRSDATASPRHRIQIPLFTAYGRRTGADGGAESPIREVVAALPAQSVGAEAFRLLYSGLMLGWGPGQRTILVTSVAPQEGKTLVVSNLAVTFARQGARVLLIDCDLRRPRLHKVFGVSADPGLAELLQSDGALLAQALEAPLRVGETVVEHLIPGIRPTETAGLSLLTCGTIPADPAEVLKPRRIRFLLDHLSRRFDVIILDAPPVMVSADAALLAPLADGAILVVRAGQTDRASAERACQHLIGAGAHLLGAVLNDPAGEVARFGKLHYYYHAYPPPAK